MGNVASISHDTFPKQACLIGHRVSVCFHYDTTHRLAGTIVRDDMEAPYEGIIRLDDGRYVRVSECQYLLLDTANRNGDTK